MIAIIVVVVVVIIVVVVVLIVVLHALSAGRCTMILGLELLLKHHDVSHLDGSMHLYKQAICW